ncbi:hypothetical protein EPO04_02780 [Patescibacteria group bacterium]|nr:MAG: hypothetical protein EPO04_02780 [Patescibacteria group bacterium]
MPKLLKVLINLVVVGLLAGLAYGLYSYSDEIQDWWVLRSYQPPANISQLADQASMNEQGRRLFYRANPEITADRNQLAERCRIQDANTIELGCYLSTNKIYLLDVQQADLADEMPVTAAHEMLHAAYDRLSRQERDQLNTELRRFYSTIVDPKLKERLAVYAKLDAGDQLNELHSILGTERAVLSPQLERYYSRYFNDRTVVVAANDRFNRTFDGLRAEIDALNQEIEATRAKMNVQLARGQVIAYNAQVPAINAKISTYNAKVDQYNRYASALLGREQVAPATQ